MKIIFNTPITQRGHNRYLLELRQLARNNRNNPTLSESKLWHTFLCQRPLGYKFLRQKPINQFILDFYCPKLLLDIEVDGDSHDTRKNYDRGRDQILAGIGINTIRYTNNAILKNLDMVMNDIKIKIALLKGNVLSLSKDKGFKC